MWARAGLAALSAVLFILAFPPFELGLLGLAATAPLLLALEGAPRPFLTAWLAGWAAYTGVVWWVVYAMARYGGVPWPVAVALMLLLTAAMGAFWGGIAWARARVRRAFPRLPDVLLVPVLWTASEYLRAHLPNLEFPWAMLGHTLFAHLPLVQVADLAGFWADTFLAAAAGAALASLLRDPRGKGWDGGWRPVAAAVVMLAGAAGYGHVRLGQAAEGGAVRVAVVQGNIPQDVKWDARFREETFGIHEGLTREAAAAGPVDLVVWSESSTAFLYQNEPGYQRRLAELVRGAGAPLLFGSPAREVEGERRTLRNRAYLLGPDGAVAGWYDKQQLVPFGEFVPFGKLLFFARPLVQAVGNFAPGTRPAVLSVPAGRFGTMICYEAVFPDLVRRFAAGGAEFLVNITNDAWYERSAASRQQFANLVFRAVENRRPVARAANTGISGFVDDRGRVIAASELFVRGRWAAALATSRRRTLYSRWGDWLPLLCVAAALPLAAAAVLLGRDRGRRPAR